MRERVGVQMLFEVRTLRRLMELVRQEGELPCGDLSGASGMAARCLINALYKNTTVIEVFVADGGVQELLEILEQGMTTYTASWLTRLLFMLAGTHPPAAKIMVDAHAVDVLVPVLAWALRHTEPPFPAGNGRFALVMDTCKLLYALRSAPSDEQFKDILDKPALGQLGVLICEVIKRPNYGRKMIQAKQQLVNLLMFMPPQFSVFLLANDGIAPIVHFLEVRVHHIVTEGHRDSGAMLSPILVVLNTLVLSSNAIKRQVKDIVFPPSVSAEELAADDVDDDDDGGADHCAPGAAAASEETKATSGPAAAAAGTTTTMAGSSSGATLAPATEHRGDRTSYPSSDPMDPNDAPRFSLRAGLIELMTSFEPVTKRYVSEFLYNLCDSSDEFTKRTGLGNAIAMLRIKGLLG